MRRRGIGLTSGVAVLAALGIAAASASSAGAATIGSNLKPNPTNGLGFGCGLDPCSVLQVKLPGNPHPAKSPFRGEVRKWRLRRGKTTGAAHPIYQVRLWVVRRDGDEWRFVRASDYRTIGSKPGTYQFDADLRIRKNDRIAMELPAGEVSEIAVNHPGATERSFFPAPLLGESATGMPGVNPAEYLWNATVKRPG